MTTVDTKEGWLAGRLKCIAAAGILALALGGLTTAGAQTPEVGRKVGGVNRQAPQIREPEQPDANRTRQEFWNLLHRYPPTLNSVFKLDPTLLSEEAYLAPYPALAAYLKAHPEIALNPDYYLGGLSGTNNSRSAAPPDSGSETRAMVRQFLNNVMIFAAFGIAIGLLTWLIRTFLDYRRWARLSRVQSEVHTKLLDRFSTNEEIMAYIATPAGSKFLQSAPISLDTGTRNMGAPMNRIMWSLQAGLVLCAAGGGLMIASGRVSDDVYLPLEVLGILAVALGVGFAVSAGVSFLLSHRLGLLDPTPHPKPLDPPEVQQ
jgi:hypothetical protein